MKIIKISKKLASLLSADIPAGLSLLGKVAEQNERGNADKAGAVQIQADAYEVTYLAMTAAERMATLDSLLLQNTTTGEDSKPYLGEHSAWRALVRQINPQPT